MTKLKSHTLQLLQDILSAKHEEKDKQLEEMQQANAAASAASADAQVSLHCVIWFWLTCSA